MRFTSFDAPDDTVVYIDLGTVCAIGPRIVEQVRMEPIAMRAIYVLGGQCLAILDTAANMSKLFETQGRPS